jgi:hypothetical protein
LNETTSTLGRQTGRETTAAVASLAARECPKCAEVVAKEDTACGFCGFAIVPRKSALVRLGEVASLTGALALIIVVCRGIGLLLGV